MKRYITTIEVIADSIDDFEAESKVQNIIKNASGQEGVLLCSAETEMLLDLATEPAEPALKAACS